jgi:hypothetical protein
MRCVRVVHCRYSDGSCRAFSAWVSALSLRGSPRCALTLTRKVRAPFSTLSLMQSMMDVMMSTLLSPASVVRGPLPIHRDTSTGPGRRACVLCVFITAGPSTKMFTWGGGGYGRTCATRDDEPRPVCACCLFFFTAVRTVVINFFSRIRQVCHRKRRSGD